eukprot:989492-Pyramimonas_sp.AAC.1
MFASGQRWLHATSYKLQETNMSAINAKRSLRPYIALHVHGWWRRGKPYKTYAPTPTRGPSLSLRPTRNRST